MKTKNNANGGAGAGNPDDSDSTTTIENKIPEDSLNALRARILEEPSGTPPELDDIAADDDDAPDAFDDDLQNDDDDRDDEDSDDEDPDSENDADRDDEDPDSENEDDDGKKKTGAKKPKDKFELRAVEKMQKRIDKKSAEIYSLREEIKRLKSEREADTPSSYAKTSDAKIAETIAAAKDEAELDGIVGKLKDNRKYLRSLLAKDIIEIEGEDGKPVEIDRKNVIAMLEDVENAIEGNAAAKRDKFRAAADSEKKRALGMKNAEKAFPWFADKNSAGRKWVEETLLDPDFESDIYAVLCYAYQGVTLNRARQAVGARKQESRAKPSISAPGTSAEHDDNGFVRANPDGTLDVSTLINRTKGLFKNG